MEHLMIICILLCSIVFGCVHWEVIYKEYLSEKKPEPPKISIIIKRPENVLTDSEREMIEDKIPYWTRRIPTVFAWLLLVREHKELFFESAHGSFAMTAVMRALIGYESGGQQFAVSPAGAVGYAQQMNVYARELGMKYDPNAAQYIIDELSSRERTYNRTHQHFNAMSDSVFAYQERLRLLNTNPAYEKTGTEYDALQSLYESNIRMYSNRMTRALTVFDDFGTVHNKVVNSDDRLRLDKCVPAIYEYMHIPHVERFKTLTMRVQAYHSGAGNVRKFLRLLGVPFDNYADAYNWMQNNPNAAATKFMKNLLSNAIEYAPDVLTTVALEDQFYNDFDQFLMNVVKARSAYYMRLFRKDSINIATEKEVLGFISRHDFFDSTSYRRTLSYLDIPGKKHAIALDSLELFNAHVNGIRYGHPFFQRTLYALSRLLHDIPNANISVSSGIDTLRINEEDTGKKFHVEMTCDSPCDSLLRSMLNGFNAQVFIDQIEHSENDVMNVFLSDIEAP